MEVWSEVGMKWKVLEMFHTQLQQDKGIKIWFRAILIIQDCFNNISKHQLAFHFPFLETLLQRDNVRYIHTFMSLIIKINSFLYNSKGQKKKKKLFNKSWQALFLFVTTSCVLAIDNIRMPCWWFPNLPFS